MTTGNIIMNNRIQLNKREASPAMMKMRSGNGNTKTDRKMHRKSSFTTSRGKMKPPSATIVMVMVMMMISASVIYANIIQIIKPIEAITTTISPLAQQQQQQTSISQSLTTNQQAFFETEVSIHQHRHDDNGEQSSTQQKLATVTTDAPTQQQVNGFGAATAEVTGAGGLSSSSSSSSSSVVAATTTKPVPVLRPSIEEVASKLSRKHLNLENWHLKAPPTSTAAAAAPAATLASSPSGQMTDGQYNWDSISANDDGVPHLNGADAGSQTMASDMNSGDGSLTVEAEQEIKVSSSQHQVVGANHSTISADQNLSNPHSAATATTITAANNQATDHYLHIDIASGGSQASMGQHPTLSSSSSPVDPPLSIVRTNSLRRKKQQGGLVFQQSYYDDNELFQCHQYLQYHSSSSPTHPQTGSSATGGSLLSQSPVVNAGLSRLLSSQLLPCSCETRQRQHDSEPSGSLVESTWLSCDNVQLMGSHFYTRTPPPKATANLNSSDTGSRHSLNLMVTKFSQRDSGLQTLHAQKFHYLQLFHLESIDLSDNRIRLIKMDAFHGLEDKLEYLNLASNLLGDSRALANEKLIFSSDELNRLRRLKWLSLRNNQIRQLGQTVFFKPTTTTTTNADTTNPNNNDKLASHTAANQGQLIHLDLSENLLNFIPSDSINQLNELKTLRLARNRIVELNQFSRFPRSLKYLDLSENLIKIVRQCELIDLPNLIELNLSHNQLAHLDKTAFVSATASSLLLSSTNNLVLTPLAAAAAVEAAAAPASESGSGPIMPNRVDDHHQYDHSQSHGPDPTSRISPPSSASEDMKSINPAGDLKGVGQISMVEATGGGESLKRNRRNSDDDLRELEATINGSGSDGDDEVERFNVESGEALEVDESSLVSAQVKAARLSSDDGSNSIQHLEQFNSTLKLNLSYNLFEKIPGDSLLKFANLQQLDLSFNRIRKLDSNYLCSIYNLVENLRHLDLSGNLLSITSQNNNNSNLPAHDIGGGRWHLNRLFGCLLRLEKLLLSTNRLATNAAAAAPPGGSVNGQPALHPVASLQEDQDYLTDQLTSSESNIQEQTSATSGTINDRLTIKFGEGFGSRYLNTLDLSDNQLKQMPIIEQVSSNPIISLNMSSSPSISNMSHHQAHLNQWMNSRLYLEILNLNYNSIERLDEQDFEHLFNLHQLSLDFNKLSQLPIKVMRRFTSLDRLSLQGNMITQLSPLNELIERSTRTLRLLNLANNRLTEWPQMVKLTSHDSNNNVDHDDPSSPSAAAAASAIRFALEELNLEGNQLTSDNVTSLFDQLLYMKSLRILNLNYNQLQRVKSEWFKFANRNLQTLSLTGNRINTIDLGSFAWNQVNDLVELNLDHNLLRELRRKTFDSLPRMRQLNLANNLLHTINSEAFHQVNSLQVLKLNNNKLTSWKCEYFSNLCNPTSGAINADLASLLGVTSSSSSSWSNQQQQENPIPSAVSSLVELDLSHNSLSQLRANSIAVHTKLAKLNLSHNKLSFIPHDLFKVTTSGQLTGRQILLVSSIKYLNLAHNHIQTIDNINFRPMRNLLSLDLSSNELQTLGVDVVLMDSKSIQQHENNRRIIISNNLTNLPLDDELYNSSRTNSNSSERQSTKNTRTGRQFIPPATNWPSLSKLRHLNVAHNQLTMVNQSLISELSPFALLNLNLSFNYLDSESLPYGFYTKINSASSASAATTTNKNFGPGTGSISSNQDSAQQNYDLVFTLKLESLDLSHNRLNEFPTNLLDNHYTSMESCNLSHNRIQNLVANSNLMVQIKSLNLEFNPLNRESNELVLFEQRSVRYLNMAATRLFAIQQATLTNADQSFLPPSSVASNPKLKLKLVNQTSQLDLIRSISKPIEAPYLRHLNLSSNQLVWLAANVFDRLHSLETLDLSNNQLTRLNLLNNQLIHVSSTLEYLNMGSNLFTSIDLNDFNQLTKLRHLDLSNLLSLQKMNCKFLSKLSTLRTLKMFNYPQLRQTINNILTRMANSTSVSASASVTNGWSDDRMQLKLMDDLISTSIGRHCFQDNNNHHHHHHHHMSSSLHDDDGYQNVDTIWLNLEQLELELFNNFHNQKQPTVESGGSFKLRDELSQVLGPHLRKLSLFGLNLTSLSDDSLFGVTSDELNLKISYTSMTQLPLRQLLFSLAKRTKLNLDFRNNNIQSIDTRGLQLLDELQLNNQVLQRSDQSSSLRLASNPIRCDCQTRPLWLWLNQRWALDSALHSATGGDDANDIPTATSSSSSPASPNYWLHPRAMKGAYPTSDLKCYYPVKLRGKLTQNVNYNDLICKGSGNVHNPSSPKQVAPATHLQASKRRNETRHSSDSYYITSAKATGGSDLSDSSNGQLDDQDDYVDYLDFAETTRTESSVRVTRFNKYPANYADLVNPTSQLWSSVNVPPATIQERPTDEFYRPLMKGNAEVGSKQQEADAVDGWNRKDRRASSSFIEYASDYANGFANQQAHQQQVNINYNKHRPNVHQRHSHYDTVSSFQAGSQAAAAASGAASAAAATGARGSPQTMFKLKHHSLLSDIDVIILAVSSIAMIVMSFIIIIICLYKYKMDNHHKGDQILLDTQGQAFLAASQAAAAAVMLHNSHGSKKLKLLNMEPCGMKQVAPSFSSSSDHSPQSTSNDVTKLSITQKGKFFTHHHHRHQLKTTNPYTRQKQLHYDHRNHQILVPTMGPAAVANNNNSPIIAPAENFLMRSPTIRRMHGFATNASDWFKFTLRAYPPPNSAAAAATTSGSSTGNNNNGGIQHHRRRRHLFIGGKKDPMIGVGGSQLTTAQFINHNNPGPISQFDRKSAKLLLPSAATLCAAGCPLHAFRSLHRLKEQLILGDNKPAPPDEPQCQHCNRLLAAVERNYHGAAGSATTTNNKVNNNSTTTHTEDGSTAQSSSLENQQSSLAEKQAANSGGSYGRRDTTSSDGASDETTIPKINRNKQVANLEQQQQQQQQDPSASNSSHLKTATHSSISGNRDQQGARNRPLRTFGSKFNHNSNNSSKIYDSQQQQQQQHHQIHSISGHLVSQIPSIDIEGRFAYQSDSHFDSPSAGSNMTNVNNNSQQSSRPNTRMGDRCSSFVGNREEMFIIVHGDNSPVLTKSSSSNNNETCLDLQQTNCANKTTIESNGMGEPLAGDGHLLTDQVGGEFHDSSMMNDECSQSSSPVAYGFMRSSPSATTLSSVTTAQNNFTPHNNNNNNHHHQDHHHHHQQHQNSINSYKNITDISNNNNNNNTGYWVHRKAETREMPPQPSLRLPGTTETKTDDQIIISRL